MKFTSDLQKAIFLSSVPLREIDPNNQPIRMGSGCLIDHGGKRILLTAAHVTKNQGRWCIELGYQPGQATSLHSLGPMNFLMKIVLGGSIHDVDFSYVEVPRDLQPLRQEIIDADTVGEEIPITVHQLDFSIKPSATRKYGFCGTVMHALEKHSGKTFLTAELRSYEGLTYLRDEADYHVFKLPMSHPGHEHFQGTSGAPVLDDQRRVVALVCSGCVSRDEIYAVSIARYRTALDILVGKI